MRITNWIWIFLCFCSGFFMSWGWRYNNKILLTVGALILGGFIYYITKDYKINLKSFAGFILKKIYKK